MKGTRKEVCIAAAATLLSFLALGLFAAGEAPDFFKGKVYILDKANLSLAQKFEEAEKEFKKSKDGEAYFTSYMFLSRHKFHVHGDWSSTEPYRATVEGNEIKLRRTSWWEKEGGKDISEKEGKEPAGILLLHQLSENKGKVVDVEIIDLDRSYEFEEVPVYWLGMVNNEESVNFLEAMFDSGNSKMQKTLVFVISGHDIPRSYDFLRRVALGDYSREVRKSAVFWLGNYKDERSLAYLKEIFRKEKDEQLKEHIIFALQLSEQKEAVEELINIAKSDGNREVRKKAVFWLGQKASKECVKALKDVVEGGEDVDVKNSAVFAISQLPKDKSVPMLIDIARSNKSPSVRKKAIFWLGQTDSEEALKFFEEILLKK
jgi:HEAT repeat protein